MDLAAELKKRLDYRQKVADELTALDNELKDVIRLLAPEDEPATFTGTGSTNGRGPEGVYTSGPNRLTDATVATDPQPTRRRRRGGYVSGVSAEQIEAYLIKRLDKVIDVDDLVARFEMKRNSATTRLWNLAHVGRIVKTGPGTYYVPAPRNGSMAETG